MSDLYQSGRYGQLNPGWHEEDAAHKARAIADAMHFCALAPQHVVDVGCGTGAVLRHLKELRDAQDHRTCTYEGWDIAPDAVREARQHEGDRLLYVDEDFLRSERRVDLILCVDTFEHVGDDVGFLRALRGRADWFVFRIPLDLSVWDAIRPARLSRARRQYGHLHLYNRSLAVQVLQDAGFTVEHERYHRIPTPAESRGGAVGNLVRRAAFRVDAHRTVAWLGGWSLLVVASPAPDPVSG